MKNRTTFHLPATGNKGTAAARDFKWIIDEPESIGGTNEGPTPTEFVNAALGACIAITLRMYAQRKEWETGEIHVEVYTTQNEHRQTEIHKKITFGNKANLSAEQLERLEVIAGKCPVSKLLQQATPVISD